MAITFNRDDFEEIKHDLITGFEEQIMRHQGIAERYARASIGEQILGYGPLPNYIRVPTGPGWALVGDAGLHQDPWSGYGIDMASMTGVFLAEAIQDWFAEASSESSAMEYYHCRRNELAAPIYRETIDVGRDLRQRSDG